MDLDDSQEEKLREISTEVLENIDLDKLDKIAYIHKEEIIEYPFEKIEKLNKHIALVYDDNFTFLYHDNLEFLQETFRKVTIVNSINDEQIPKDADTVFICGGYIETKDSYDKYKNSNNFQNSLILHSKTKPIYGECAGLIVLGNRVDDYKLLGLLSLDFTLKKRFVRMGYYENDLGITGHAFHYTDIIDVPKGEFTLYKVKDKFEVYGAFKEGNVFGTYLHTMFRNNFSKIKRYLI